MCIIIEVSYLHPVVTAEGLLLDVKHLKLDLYQVCTRHLDRRHAGRVHRVIIWVVGRGEISRRARQLLLAVKRYMIGSFVRRFETAGRHETVALEFQLAHVGFGDPDGASVKFSTPFGFGTIIWNTGELEKQNKKV